MSDGIQIKEKEVYRYFSKLLRNSQHEIKEHKIKYLLEKFKKYFHYYQYFINPELLQDRTGKIKTSLKRLKYIPSTKYYPFLLKCFDYCNFDNSNKDTNSLYEIFKIIETLYIRRFVCGESEKEYEKCFSDLCLQLTNGIKEPIADFVRHSLSQSLPADCSFESKIHRTSLYSENSSNNSLTKLILLSVEDNITKRDFKFPYHTDDITIEHVMPQKLTPEWQKSLGDDWEDIHTHWCHTIGNLTLASAKVQPSLSNKIFEEKKKDFYLHSGFNLNKEFQKFQIWDINSIKSRSNDLTNIIENS